MFHIKIIPQSSSCAQVGCMGRWHWQSQIYPLGKPTPTRVPQLSCCTRKDFTPNSSLQLIWLHPVLAKTEMNLSSQQNAEIRDVWWQKANTVVVCPLPLQGWRDSWRCNLTDLPGTFLKLCFTAGPSFFMILFIVLFLSFSAWIFVLRDLIHWGLLGSNPWYVSTYKASYHPDLCILQQNSSWSQSLIQAFKTWPQIKHKTYVQ